MQRNACRYSLVTLAAALFTAFFALSAPAEASCREVEIASWRMPNIELLSVHGAPLRTVRSRDLEGIRTAQLCTEDEAYLLVRVDQQQVLVRRRAIALAEDAFGERPLCPCPDRVASAGDRTAADPGAGSGLCRRNDNCGR